MARIVFSAAIYVQLRNFPKNETIVPIWEIITTLSPDNKMVFNGLFFGRKMDSIYANPHYEN